MLICSAVINPFSQARHHFLGARSPSRRRELHPRIAALGLDLGSWSRWAHAASFDQGGGTANGRLADETRRSLAPLHVAQTLHMVWAESWACLGKASTSVTGQEFPVSRRGKTLVRREALDRARLQGSPHQHQTKRGGPCGRAEMEAPDNRMGRVDYLTFHRVLQSITH
jgi:hypothetical protein